MPGIAQPWLACRRPGHHRPSGPQPPLPSRSRA